MSKASKYAEAKASISSPTHFSKNPLHQTAMVTDEGSLYLSSGIITPQEALCLRDWLTETFEDEQLNSKPENIETISDQLRIMAALLEAGRGQFIIPRSAKILEQAADLLYKNPDGESP